mgnify:CR=1 FL=1
MIGKMGIKKAFKKIDNLFSDSVFFMGSLTNFGLITIALLSFLIKETLFEWPIFWNLNFIFSFILTTIFFISQYIWLFFL